MKIKILLMSLIGLLITTPAFAEDSYLHAMRRDLVRGFKNVLTSPLEIPIAIQEYHESAGKPYVRQMAGFFDGTFQMLTRLGSGVWDIPAAFIPGIQEGLPPTPETLF
jgi:putative exosortase-associated protein (TIGR04073 family)